MSDRHVRRLGQDYGTAFLSLLPQGQAWPKNPGTTLDLACRGLAEYWGYVDSRAADLLEQESDPRYTIELLPDWERNWGLPDPCYDAPQTIAERQLALIMRMTMEGSQSREFFIGVAEMLGYSITITEYRTFVVGLDRVGDNRVYGDGSNPMYNEWGNPILNVRGEPVAEGELSEWPYYGLGPETNRFYWTVHVDNARLIWFRVSSGQTGVDPHLRIGTFEDLECLLNRWKPAHTEIIFDYSGLQDQPEITLSARIVAEDAPVGTIVGTFDVINAYAGTPVYTLTDDAGGKFTITGNQLKVAAALDYETAATLDITVMANDMTPIPGASTFTITVTDIPEGQIVLTGSTAVREDVAIGTTVGTLSVLYATGTPVFTLTDSAGGKFAISGNNLNVAAALDYEAAMSHTVTVAVSGMSLPTPAEKFTITVIDVVELGTSATAMGANGPVVAVGGVSRQAYIDGVMVNI